MLHHSLKSICGRLKCIPCPLTFFHSLVNWQYEYSHKNDDFALYSFLLCVSHPFNIFPVSFSVSFSPLQKFLCRWAWASCCYGDFSHIFFILFALILAYSLYFSLYHKNVRLVSIHIHTHTHSRALDLEKKLWIGFSKW